MAETGRVTIIGAGPGDPGLITLRAVQCIREAEVIVYDHLVGPEILRHASPKARLIYAGKQGGKHTISQGEINALLVAEARKGAVVARLKGGDPFIFGRGGEEAEVLKEAGIPFEVVPGVSSAIAVPAYAGIPLTHRSHTASVAFVTGHEDPTKGKSNLDWPTLAGMGTLVVLMAVKNLSAVTENLIRHGKDAATPAALIRWGTTPDQETLTGTLGDIAQKGRGAWVCPSLDPGRRRRGRPPGDPQLVRDETPLRPGDRHHPAGGPGRGVRGDAPAAGARVILFPVIRVAPPETWETLDEALGRIEDYRWIIFTSANGVAFFFRRLREIGRDIRDLKGIRIAAIGPATAAAVEALGIRVDLVPEEFVSEGVVKAFAGEDLRGGRVLLPRAAEARDVIPEGLAALGARCDIATTYRTIRSDRSASELEPLFADGKVDAISFTSPSTVKNFLGIMGPAFRLPPGVRIACIGPVTAAAARKAGLPVDILQERFTIPGMVEALTAYFKKEKRG